MFSTLLIEHDIRNFSQSEVLRGNAIKNSKRITSEHFPHCANSAAYPGFNKNSDSHKFFFQNAGA